MNLGVNFFTRAIWMLHSDQKKSKILYLSRINGEENGWYFWLKEIVGVYGLKFSRLISLENATEVSEFSLKYYPGLDEDALDTFSLREQLLRYSDIFDNTLIDIFKTSPEKTECPYCGVKKETTDGIYEDCECSCAESKERTKGIPIFGERSRITSSDFEIAKIILTLKEQKLKKVELKTKSEYVDYVIKPTFLVNQNGEEKQILAANEMDRCVQGLKLSESFYRFLINELFIKMGKKPFKEEIFKDKGSVFYKTYQEGFKEKIVEKHVVSNVSEIKVVNEY
jgi:hypothetical protein